MKLQIYQAERYDIQPTHSPALLRDADHADSPTGRGAFSMRRPSLVMTPVQRRPTRYAVDRAGSGKLEQPNRAQSTPEVLKLSCFKSIINNHRVVGIILLVLGAFLFEVGVNASHSLADLRSGSFIGYITSTTVWDIIGGVGSAAIGLVLVMFGDRIETT